MKCFCLILKQMLPFHSCYFDIVQIDRKWASSSCTISQSLLINKILILTWSELGVRGPCWDRAWSRRGGCHRSPPCRWSSAAPSCWGRGCWSVCPRSAGQHRPACPALPGSWRPGRGPRTSSPPRPPCWSRARSTRWSSRSGESRLRPDTTPWRSI